MPRGGLPLVTAKWIPASCSACTASTVLGASDLSGRDERAVDVREEQPDHFMRPVAADQRVRRGVVGELGLVVGSSSSGTIRCASTLPSSTPHWSKELMPQTVPCVKTLCS